MPLLQAKAAKIGPGFDLGEPDGIWPVAVAAALAVQFSEPEPDMRSRERDPQLLSSMLIDDQAA